jgi:putative hydrolase of the HAD superfamily
VKPEPANYLDAIRGLALPPAEMLFLDDKPENVEGARAVGLQTERFTTWEEFVRTGAARRHQLPEPD